MLRSSNAIYWQSGTTKVKTLKSKRPSQSYDCEVQLENFYNENVSDKTAQIRHDIVKELIIIKI